MTDLLGSIFIFPFRVQGLYIDSWLIGGRLCQALCKLVAFLKMCPVLCLSRAWF